MSCVAIPAPVLEAALSSLIEQRILRRVHFVPLISRSKPGVEALLRLAEFLFRECEHTDADPTTSPLTAHLMAKTFLAHLLEILPHNYSDDIVAGPGPTVPWYVHYCEEHIQDHLNEPLSMTEMASAVKTSVRTIHEGFRRYRGYSPMEFRRKLRLERVRAELLNPANGKTVTEVATDWCFWHLGRFSRAYFSAFGERPSATLLRAKNKRLEDKSEHVRPLTPSGGPPLAIMNASLQRFARAGA